MKHLKTTITLLLVMSLIWPTLGLADNLQKAKRAEYISGSVKKALQYYHDALLEGKGEGEEAHLGVIRCLRKLGRDDDARSHIAILDEATFSKKGRVLLNAEKGYLRHDKEHSFNELEDRYVSKLDSLSSKDQKKLRLQFNRIRLDDVIRMLSKAGDFQYVISPSVAEKKISLDLKDVSPLEAIQIIANAAGADVANIGDRYTVAPKEELSRMKMAAEKKRKEGPSILLDLRLVEMVGNKEKRVVASPRVLALNNQQATVSIGGKDKSGSESLIEIKAHTSIEKNDFVKVTVDCNVVETKDQKVNQQRKSFKVRLKDGAPFRQRMSKQYLVEVTPRIIKDMTLAKHKLSAKKKQARERACFANQKVMTHALHLYLNDNGLKAKNVDETVFQKLVAEGYLTAIPTDPGSGKGSENHYKIKGDRVVCSQHGPLPTGQ